MSKTLIQKQVSKKQFLTILILALFSLNFAGLFSFFKNDKSTQKTSGFGQSGYGL
jgi:hypothetical protein